MAETTVVIIITLLKSEILPAEHRHLRRLNQINHNQIESNVGLLWVLLVFTVTPFKINQN